MRMKYCDLCGSVTHNQSDHDCVSGTLCEHERPIRKVICQKIKGHEGSHAAVIYWE